MSRFSDVTTMLKSLPLTACEFDHVKIGTKVPFGEYTFSEDTFSGDNKVLVKLYTVTLMIYTAKLDAKLDAAIEKALSDNELSWRRSVPEWMEDSSMYGIEYTFQFLDD